MPVIKEAAATTREIIESLAHRHKSLDPRGTHDSTSMTAPARLSSMAERRSPYHIVGRRGSAEKPTQQVSGLGEAGQFTTEEAVANERHKSLQNSRDSQKKALRPKQP